jgi:hypothetical protein
MVVVFALRKPAPRAAAKCFDHDLRYSQCVPPAGSRAEFSQRENCYLIRDLCKSRISDTERGAVTRSGLI